MINRVPGLVQRDADYFDTWTPTWQTAGTQPVLGNGSISAYYAFDGHALTFALTLTAGSTTTFGTSGWEFTLPSGFTAVGLFQPVAAKAVDASAGLEYAMVGTVGASGAVVGAFTYGTTATTGTAPFTWADGDSLVVCGSVLMGDG